MKTKICTVCHVEKSIEEFGPRKGRLNARSSCRACDNIYLKECRQKNLDKFRRRNREFAAKKRLAPGGRDHLLEIQRKCYHNGGKERESLYLEKLKQTNFFKWKARRSYVWLTEEELKTLWNNQNGLCALSGRPLDENSELDHIIPKTRGGTNCFQNSQWLCKEANQAKRNLLDDEFIALCVDVINYRLGNSPNGSAAA